MYPEIISQRKLPANFNQRDWQLFERALERVIPANRLLEFENVKVSHLGIIFRGNKIFSESFAFPQQLNAWNTIRKLTFLVNNHLFKIQKRLSGNVFGITDNWSYGYFHWIADALPRLLTIQKNIANGILLLPGHYQQIEYVQSSLRPFSIQTIQYIKEYEVALCQKLIMPTHTAPTGSYNDHILRDLRSLYTDFYKSTRADKNSDKIYISRGKAQKRRIKNEEALISILKDHDFQIMCFEDYPFEQQVKSALQARYLVSNHGAGLTNILFMTPGSNVLELRKEGALINCYFNLASALKLNYFYQICDAENPNEDAHTANLIVNLETFRKNIELMLTY